MPGFEEEIKVRVTSAMKRQVAARAKQQGVKESTVVRWALALYFEGEGASELREEPPRYGRDSKG